MTRAERQMVEGQTEVQFHFFPLGWPHDSDFELADLLVSIGFREVTAGGRNYGPVLGDGAIHEHHITFRRSLIETSTFCAGLEAEWYEMPPHKPARPWRFSFWQRAFPEGAELQSEHRKWYLETYEWDQGGAPHCWLSVETLGGPTVEKSRILYSSLNHLEQKWVMILDTFDTSFAERMGVAMDEYARDRDELRFIDSTHGHHPWERTEL